jgi:pyrroline-5-carboxylate reductase
MPITPALIGKGISGLAATPSVDKESQTLADRLLASVGFTVWVDEEEKIDAVTAISGSGSAYVFYFIEALQEAAARLGLSEEQGRNLAIATFEGAAQLANNSNESPSFLRESITSKGGTTAAALATFDSLDVKESIVQGAIAADKRATAMADEFSKAD